MTEHVVSGIKRISRSKNPVEQLEVLGGFIPLQKAHRVILHSSR